MILKFFPILAIGFFINSAYSSSNFNLDNLSNFRNILGKELSPSEKEFLFKSIIPFYHQDFFLNPEKIPPPRNNISSECEAHLQIWRQEFLSLNLAPWALQMIDAWGKMPEGILSGHLMTYGDFDECVQIEAVIEDSKPPIFNGQYCSVYVLPKDIADEIIGGMQVESNGSPSTRTALTPAELIEMLSTFQMPMMIPQTAACLPSSCSQEDIAYHFENILYGFSEIISMLPVSCVKGGKKDLTDGAIVMITILATLGTICIVGTILDLFLRERRKSKSSEVDGESPKSPKYGIPLQLILAFSLYTNTIRWLNTNGGGDNLGCVHGLRFLSMCWVVLCHTWAMLIAEASIWNLVDVKQMYKANWTMNTILNGTVSVDTFFAMSGLLVAYNLLKMLEKSKGKFNLPMFYLHRYLRLTPMYALIIGFIATLLPYMANGPRHHLLEFNADVCRRHWWHNLLYVNNLITYAEGDEKCEIESWYISNDMQFYILSPLILYPLYRWEKMGLGILSAFTISSIAMPAAIIAENKLIPTTLTHTGGRSFENTADFVNKLYIKPWTRIGPYLVGIWLGWILFKLKNRKDFKLSLPIALIGWTLSTGTALAIIYAPFNWNDPKTVIGEIEAWIYGGLHRSLWGLVICWVIFACMKGRGWLINSFLSWKAFIPLGRLTFATYLVSFPIQICMSVIKGKMATYYSEFTWTTNFFAELTLSLLVAFLCTITMESPFMTVEKLIFGR